MFVPTPRHQLPERSERSREDTFSQSVLPEKTMKYLLGIDFGGGSSKVTLLDTRGNIAAEHAVEYPTAHPAPGACEQSPADWLSALCENTRAVLDAGFSASDILAVAIDSATHTAVLCDGKMTPLRPAIHWTDSRAQAEAEELREAHRRFLEK